MKFVYFMGIVYWNVFVENMYFPIQQILLSFLVWWNIFSNFITILFFVFLCFSLFPFFSLFFFICFNFFQSKINNKK